MKSIMIQGTTSDAGKSMLATGLCRVYSRRGIKVAPFKPQNMSLNSAVTIDGGEIGRAQALQAVACGIEPHSDMNPVLLKPCTNTGAQLIVRGRVRGEMDARAYHQYKARVMPEILAAYSDLLSRHERIVIEGAGSPAEINLREHDVANMGFAEAVDCPVILVADIDRGGVFAHLYGTLALLSPAERSRVIGFAINKFRGDVSLLEPGIRWLEESTGKRCLGVIPFLPNLNLDPEDSLSNGRLQTQVSQRRHFTIVIPQLPRLSNFTDFLPLQRRDDIKVVVVDSGQKPPADLVILPGSKSVISDLTWLRENGWQAYLERHLRYGGHVLGICGGFQMLGQRIDDPTGIESSESSAAGFGFLQISTIMQPSKVLTQRSGRLSFAGRPEVTGYEIHMGHSEGADRTRPFVCFPDGTTDGGMSADEQIAGTYLHGLFDRSQAAEAILRWAGNEGLHAAGEDWMTIRQQQIDRVADAIEQSLLLEHLDACFAR